MLLISGNREEIEGHFPYSNEFSRVAPHPTKKVLSDRVSLVPLIGTKFQIREGVDSRKMLYKLKMKLLVGSILVLMLNLPFGYWRARTKTFSAQWLLAIHLPVPLVVFIRIFGGIGFQFATYPLLAGSFFTGQWVGGRLRDWRQNQESARD